MADRPREYRGWHKKGYWQPWFPVEANGIIHVGWSARKFQVRDVPADGSCYTCAGTGLVLEDPEDEHQVPCPMCRKAT